MKVWCSYEYIISYIFSAILPDNVKHCIRMVLLSLPYFQRETMAIRHFALIFMICDMLPFLSSDRVVRSLIAYTLMFGFDIFLFKDQFKYRLFVMITYLMILFLPEFLFVLLLCMVFILKY